MPRKTALQTALEADEKSLLSEIKTLTDEIHVVESDDMIVNNKMVTSSRKRRLKTLVEAAKQRRIRINNNEEPEIVLLTGNDLTLQKFHTFAKRFCMICKKHKTTKKSLPCYIRGGLQRISAYPQGLESGRFKQPAEIIKYRDGGIICTALVEKKKI